MTGNCFSVPQRVLKSPLPTQHFPSAPNSSLTSGLMDPSPLSTQEPGPLQHNPHPGGAAKLAPRADLDQPLRWEPSPPFAQPPPHPRSQSPFSHHWDCLSSPLPPRAHSSKGGRRFHAEVWTWERDRQRILLLGRAQGGESIPRRVRGGSRFQRPVSPLLCGSGAVVLSLRTAGEIPINALGTVTPLVRLWLNGW